MSVPAPNFRIVSKPEPAVVCECGTALYRGFLATWIRIHFPCPHGRPPPRGSFEKTKQKAVR